LGQFSTPSRNVRQTPNVEAMRWDKFSTWGLHVEKKSLRIEFVSTL
jgi:hypothetical protein